ncbi:hypothetical protein ACH4TX_41655 [Streptomyces sp. NPDC021098]|uniref:hypothetical protein n=1 Tax=unclassified Streptomyces TaxID=2593676 RepID=UPI003796A5B7
MTATYRIKGTTTDTTTCNCCGRTNLRRTVILIPLDADGNEHGEVGYYGTGCAATLLTWTSNQISNAAKHADTQAEIDRHYALERARRILTVFEPVEHAPIRQRAAAYRDSGLHVDGPFTTVTQEIEQMLAEARTLLAPA